jgi:hypothetical protein
MLRGFGCAGNATLEKTPKGAQPSWIDFIRTFSRNGSQNSLGAVFIE